MFTVTLNQSENTLTIAYRGRVTPDETRVCEEEVKFALTILEPNFRLVVDLTGLEAMDLSCSSVIASIMKRCNAAGVAEVLRIIPDPTRDIGLQILSFFHYSGDVYVHTCATLAEANGLLKTETT
jgi:anti-anti-sigma regulatory factor